MGKKSRKKKTGKTAVPSTTAGAAASVGAAAGAPVGRGGYADTNMLLPAGTTLVLPSSCFHGSNLADFKNPEYAEAMQAYISVCSDIRKVGQDSNQAISVQQLLLEKFYDEHEHLTKHDADFCQFVFAYSTHLYQKYYHLSAKYKLEVTTLLHLGLRMRYQYQVEKGVSIDPGSENNDKWKKYNRDLDSERLIIKCLARETPCKCMDSKKVEAQGMDKTNRCNGCFKHFRKDLLSNCTGCQITRYCSKTCQVNEWPNHRDFCKSVQKTKG